MDELEKQLLSFSSSLPLFGRLTDYLKVEGRRIAWHCHLTSLTVVAARSLLQAGAKVTFSECDPRTSCSQSIDYLRRLGAEVHVGPDSAIRALESFPEILCDTGAVLILACIAESPSLPIRGASEITTSGIKRLGKSIPFPVIDLNSGVLKQQVENFHGVGDGVVELLRRLAPRSWAGRKILVVGYGRVGAGVAHHLRSSGAVVTVVELDPVRRLCAHYDGFSTSTLHSALGLSEVVVTATACPSIISAAEFELSADGCLYVNVGHFDCEIDVAYLEANSSARQELNPYLTEYIFRGRRLYLACDAHPANVVMLSGSPEPTLIHLTNEILTMNYLLEGWVLPPGLQPIPYEVEKLTSTLALEALGEGLK